MKELTNIAKFSALLAIGLVCIVILPLTFKSLWIDELLTWWAIKDGFGSIAEKFLKYPSILPGYLALELLVVKLFGNSELVLRSISLASFVLTLCTLYAWGSIKQSKTFGLSLVLFLCCFPAVLTSAVYARPYALGLFFATISLTTFVDSLDSGAEPGLALIWAALATYTHFFFIFLFPSFILAYLASKNGRTNAKALLKSLLISALLLLPLIPQFQLLTAQRSSLAFAARPSLSDLAELLLPFPMLAKIILLSLIFVGMQRFKSAPPSQAKFSNLSIVSACVLLVPTLFGFGVSRLGPTSIFLPRYLLLSSLGSAIGFSLLVSSIFKKGVGVIFSALLLCLALMYNISDLKYSEGWREISIRSQSYKTTLLFSGLIELLDNDKIENPNFLEYLLAPAYYYKINPEKLPLPFPGLGLSEQLQMRLSELSSFYFMCRIVYVNSNGKSSCDHYNDIFVRQGFKPIEQQQSGAVLGAGFAKSEFTVNQNTH